MPEAGDTGHGGFRLGPMALALPMAALREVLPCQGLLPLPCPAACVVGGIDLRGVIVPVLDLRLLLAPGASTAACPNVVIVVHGGRLLGLLCDDVTGIFQADARGLAPMRAEDPLASVMAGSLRRADEGTLVSVLSAEALAQLPQVPWVDDPEPRRQAGQADTQLIEAAGQDVPMLMARSGRSLLAIDAMSVHATLSAPVLAPSVLGRGHCLGVLEHAGLKIPAVDLAALCGYAPLSPQDGRQAFVLRLDRGLVACLVGEVMDVVRTAAADLIPVPAYALSRPELFSGALDLLSLPGELQARLSQRTGQFLVLNSEALRQCEDLSSLAGFNQGAAAAGPSTGTAQSASANGRPRRSMITYALDGETATPLEQVSEILPFSPDILHLQSGHHVMGLLINRGRSIPVMCLSTLTGLSRPAACEGASVLVVETEGGLTGFAVPALQTIEAADWEPELPRHGQGQPDALAQALGSRKLAHFGTEGRRRTLRVMDLQSLARALQAQPMAA